MNLRVFTTDTDSGTVTVLDPTKRGSNLIASIPVGNAPRGAVKFTQKGMGYVSNCAGDTISVIDLYAHKEVDRIKVGLAPRGIGILPNQKYALVSNSGDNTISIVDLNQKKEVHTIKVGRDPRHMGITPDGKFAFVCIWGGQYVSKISVEELRNDNPNFEDVKEIAHINVGDDFYPYSLSLDYENSRLYVANTQSNYLTVIDYNENQVINQVDLGSKGGRAIALTPDGRYAFVTIENQSEVVAIDTQTFDIIKRIPTGAGPRGIALDSSSGTLYTADFQRPGGNFALHSELKGGLTRINLTKPISELRKSQKLELDIEITYQDISTGKGCCSVALIDLDYLQKTA